MNHQLPFFPHSLPDESLISRVSRYHILSGNKTINGTFDELFGKKPFSLEQVVPVGIDVLAQRLPGEQRSSLKALLLENTLFPIFLPFLAPNRPSNFATDSSEIVSHIPRRVVGMHGEAHLCIDCVAEDRKEHGVPYLHRSHQIPGVSVCWKHQTPLLSSCPLCSCPFLFPKKLLGMPWLPCRCSWQPTVSSSLLQSSDEKAYQYAVFAHDLLKQNLSPISPALLFSIYKKQARQLGFSRGKGIAAEELQNTVIDHYGEAFIKDTDTAYASARRKNWLRLTSYQSALDTPITRHILLGLFLFESVERFTQQILKEEVQLKLETRSRHQETNSAFRDTKLSSHQREHHRKKVLNLKQRRPTATIQEIWKQAFKSMSWLYDNDRAWLQKYGLQPKSITTHKTVSPSIDDELLAAQVDDFAKNYFSNDSGKPHRLTVGRLLECLGKKLCPSSDYRKRFPLTFDRIDYHTESPWHFRARRILWAIGELQSFGESISTSNIEMISGVNFHWINNIVDYCEWNYASLARQSINIPSFLLRSGIPHNWPGPRRPDSRMNGGRRHISQSKIEPKSYLDFILNSETSKPHS